MGDEMDGEMGRQMRGDVAQKRAPIIFQARQLFFNPIMGISWWCNG